MKYGVGREVGAEPRRIARLRCPAFHHLGGRRRRPSFGRRRLAPRFLTGAADGYLSLGMFAAVSSANRSFYKPSDRNTTPMAPIIWLTSAIRCAAIGFGLSSTNSAASLAFQPGESTLRPRCRAFDACPIRRE